MEVHHYQEKCVCVVAVGDNTEELHVLESVDQVRS